MLRPSVRRLFVGLVVAGLLATAAPARASGFRLESGLQLQDLWSRTWSWLADLLRVDEGRSEDAATSSNYTKDAPPGPPPGPPPPGQRGRPSGMNGGGDHGGGVDPDG